MYLKLQTNQSILPIGVIREITNLTDRQIRYYEQKGFLMTKRSPGNQRKYSLEDAQILIDIKNMLNAGDSFEEIKEQINRVKKTDDNLSKYLEDEFKNIGRL